MMDLSPVKNPIPYSRGFVLVELVIVMMLAILILIFANSFSGVLNSHKLNATAGTIAQDIRLAQQLNLDQDAVYTVLFDCVNNRYFIYKDMSLYKKVNLPAGVKLVYTNFDFDNNPGNGCDNRLRFNSRGEPFRSSGILCGGHLSLSDKNGNYLYVIVASITGRVRIDSEMPL